MHITFEKTQNDKIDEILDDINESVQHLNFNDKTPMEDNNEEMDKDQPISSHQQEMISNSFVPPKELSYVDSHPPELIIDNPFKGTKTIAFIRNINEHCAYVSHIEPESFLETKKDAN
jgi:hypothetical protein